MTAPICPADGLPYTQHPPGQPPTSFYRRVRQAAIMATARAIYLPGITDNHRRAILRARRERQVSP